MRVRVGFRGGVRVRSRATRSTTAAAAAAAVGVTVVGAAGERALEGGQTATALGGVPPALKTATEAATRGDRQRGDTVRGMSRSALEGG